MSGIDLRSRLSASWFGRDLPPHVLERLAEWAEERTFAEGAVLFREGSEATELGVVVSGRVALRLLVPERGPVTILTVEPGDLYNWSALVSPHRSTSTAIALEPVEAVVLPATRLRAELSADAALAATVYPRVLRAVARRLEATRTQLLDLYSRDEPVPW